MITNVNELKALILWAKSEKVKSLKVGEITFEFSDIALLADLPEFKPENRDLSVPASSERLPDGNAQANEDEEDLFYSTR